jgi:chromosome condensin MukBEF ATPase and DNA-binding subunit MukB
MRNPDMHRSTRHGKRRRARFRGVKLPFISPTSIAKAVQEQAAAVAALPQAAATLNRTLVAFAQTVSRLDTLVRRLDRLTEPLEEPLAALAPRLELLVPLLDDDVLGAVPELFETLRNDAVPALQRIDQTQQQVQMIAESVERIMGGLDETLNRLSGLPGMGLIQRRRSPGTAVKDQP